MFALIALCILMFFGCYAAGYLVLAFHYSPRYLRIVTIFGAGLLVGAALAIIIPEGIATVYSVQLSTPAPHADTLIKVAAVPANRVVLSVEKRVPAVRADSEKEIVQLAREAKANFNNNANIDVDAHSVDGHEHTENIHNLIGLSLTLGFVIMFIVDQLGVRGCQVCTRPIWMLCCCSGCNTLPSSVDDTIIASVALSEHSARTTTLGLVVHSLADGIAIGAAFGLTLDLTLVLFVAIMLHKAPAAFGFTSFLMNEGLPRHRVKFYLFIFALASPIGAIVTYLGILFSALLTSSSSGPSTTGTGYALLVSGGTFLYVATAHILPHLSSASSHSTTALHDQSPSAATKLHPHSNSFTKCETVAFVVGSVLPVLIAFGHSH